MTAAERILSRTAALPLGRRTLLRFRGPDRLRYLNGQLTNDLREIPADQSIHSCVTDAKGRLLAEVRVFDHEESLWVDAPVELRESLAERLDRYLIADEVEWIDESDQWRLLHLVGGTRKATSPDAGAIPRQTNRLGLPGVDLWLPASNPTSLEDLLGEFGTLDTPHAEAIRIASGVPAWGAELTEGLLPPEAGLDRTAISYTKGCYIGQEVISRIRSVGRVNRHLVRLHLDPATDPSGLAGTELQDPASGKTAGQLTSVSPLMLDGDEFRNALGFRSRQAGDVKRLELVTELGRSRVTVAD